jgi:hypothetical protein
MNNIAGTTIANAVAHDLIHIPKNPSSKPMLIKITANEITLVFTIPIRSAKKTRCFESVFMFVEI